MEEGPVGPLLPPPSRKLGVLAYHSVSVPGEMFLNDSNCRHTNMTTIYHSTMSYKIFYKASINAFQSMLRRYTSHVTGQNNLYFAQRFSNSFKLPKPNKKKSKCFYQILVLYLFRYN